jgi:cytochrome c biogenesis protein ResB
MGQVLAEAISELNTLITKPHKDGWLPTNDWTYVRQKWGCIVTVERNEVAGRKGLPQHLTYGILHSAMVGLWGGLFSKGVYRGAKFVIVDGKWGFVGSGSIAPWGNGTVLSP